MADISARKLRKRLVQWAASRGIQAVVWTALQPKFKGQERTPTCDEVVEYLGGLTGVAHENAERLFNNTHRLSVE